MLNGQNDENHPHPGFIRHCVSGSLLNRSGARLWRLLCAVALPGVLSAACSTMANLGAAAIYFMRRGKLYLDLKHDTGIMEFARQ